MFANDMLLYIGAPKEPIKRLMELIREFDKVAEYKINKHKLMALVYTNNLMAEKNLSFSPF